MIATAIIIFSAIVFLMTTLDILLSPKQKDAIQLRTLRLWNWIDDVKRLLPLHALRERGERLFKNKIVQDVAGFAFLLALLLFLFQGPRFETGLKFIGSLIAEAFFLAFSLGTMWLVLTSINFLLSAALWWDVLVRAFVICAAWWLWAYRFLPYLMPQVEYSLLYFAYLSLFGITIGAAVIPATVPILAAVLLSGLLTVSETLMRRLAEYPKGVILGVSGLAGAISGALKLFL
ncbi:MAG TPA: hypothetical protein VFB02_24465 [Bradyrhizobium sp.]|nr:hypothetical protein [Bradyrhizobium sp.]